MNNEVEEFLRRAAQRRAQVEAQMRAQAEAKAQRQPAPPPQQQRMAPPQSVFQPQQPQTPTFPTAQIVPAQIVSAELADQSDRLGSGVSQHLRGSQQIAQHVEELGDAVEMADDNLEARLHNTFDHQVGRLKKIASEPVKVIPPERMAATVTAAAYSTSAAGLMAMFRTKTDVRNAILLSEIISRPTDRW